MPDAMQAIHPPSLQRQAIARAFSRAAPGYDQVAHLQRMTGGRLLDCLGSERFDHLIDLGTGTGYFVPQLAARSRVLLGLDLAEGMLRQARLIRQDQASWLAADAGQLPLADACIDGIYSNLALQWVDDLSRTLAELHRVLRPGGKAFITTLVEGTLEELARSWGEIDNYPHVNTFLTRTTLETALQASPFADQACEVICHRLTYPHVRQLLRELKGVGATHVPGRHQGLVSAATLRRLERVYQDRFPGEPGIVASWQVAYIRLEKND